MITLLGFIVLAMLAVFAFVGLFILITGGITFLAVFGDVIIFVVIIVVIVKLISRKKNKGV